MRVNSYYSKTKAIREKMLPNLNNTCKTEIETKKKKNKSWETENFSPFVDQCY